jgi:nitrogen fixation/metabolism regulation signal transduction histidine kinase
MKLTIFNKLFMGFMVVVLLNSSYVIIVSKLTVMNNITTILKKQNEIKTTLVRIQGLHKSQNISRYIFNQIGSDKNYKTFIENQDTVINKLNDVLQNITSIMVLDSLIQKNKKSTSDPTLLFLKKSFADILIYNTRYNTAFVEYSAAKKNKAIAKSNILNTIIDTADTQIKTILHVSDSLIDIQTTTHIQDIEERINDVRNLTQLIFLAIFLFSSFFALIFSRYFSSSLRKLKEATSFIAKGNFNIDPTGYPNDEIGDLATAFFEMAHDLKKTQDELIKKRRMAAIGEIVASINHEINNPLMIISGNAQFLEMTLRNGATKDTIERIHTILEETDRISQVTRKLRDIKNPVVEDYTSTGEQMINLDKSSR